MSILKRNAAVVVLAGLVLGGAAVAWAGGGPPRPTVLALAQTGDTTTPPSTPPTPADRRARREAARACLEAAGQDAAARRACLDAAGPHKPGGGPNLRGGPLGGLGMLGKAVHGSVVVPGEAEGTWQTVTFDRGTVNEATDGGTIVLDRPDGEQVTLALTADTTFHGVADAAAIQEGKPAMVVSKDGTATQVVQRDPATAARPDHPTPGNNSDAPVVPND